MAWNSVPYGRPCDSKALSPFCVLVGGMTRRVLSDAERVTGPCGGLDLTFKLLCYGCSCLMSVICGADLN